MKNPDGPIHTDALAKKIVEADWKHNGMSLDFDKWPGFRSIFVEDVACIKPVLDEALAEHGEVCEWRKIEAFRWARACATNKEFRGASPGWSGWAFCPYCGKLIREAPLNAQDAGNG